MILGQIKSAPSLLQDFMACLDGRGKEGGVKESKVKLTKNKLILC